MAVSSAVKISIVGIVGAILCAIGAVLYVIFPNIVKSKISENLRIVNGTELFINWRDAPIPIYMQFYFLNVTNSEDILRNSSIKPILQELGPYTYREYRKKVNISFDEENGTVSYEQLKWFIFEPNMTRGSLEDLVTIPNVPLISMGTKTEGRGAVERMFINSLVKTFKPPIFVTKTVDELLYAGYEDDMMIYIAKRIKQEVLPNGRFGFQYLKNDTADGVYTVYTGTKDSSKYPTIATWNHSSTLPFWNDTYCDMINGSDGSSFTPFLTKEDPIKIFSTELCRSLYLLYDEDSEVHGIKTFHYTTPFSLLADPSINPDNQCFCKGEFCSLSGLLNISICQKGAPIIMTPVHFYQSDPTLLKSVIGLKPNKAEHDTVLDVEPTTGVVLRASRKIQVNIFVKPMPHIFILKNLPTLVFPIMWVNESADIGPEKAELFKAKIFKPVLIGKAVTYALIAIGAFILVIAIIFFIRLTTQKKVAIEKSFAALSMLQSKLTKLLMDSQVKMKMIDKPSQYKNNSHLPQDEVSHSLLNNYPT